MLKLTLVTILVLGILVVLNASVICHNGRHRLDTNELADVLTKVAGPQVPEFE